MIVRSPGNCPILLAARTAFYTLARKGGLAQTMASLKGQIVAEPRRCMTRVQSCVKLNIAS